MFNDSGFFYYSTNGDLTRSLQSLPTVGSSAEPIWKMVRAFASFEGACWGLLYLYLRVEFVLLYVQL